MVLITPQVDWMKLIRFPLTDCADWVPVSTSAANLDREFLPHSLSSCQSLELQETMGEGATPEEPSASDLLLHILRLRGLLQLLAGEGPMAGYLHTTYPPAFLPYEVRGGDMDDFPSHSPHRAQPVGEQQDTVGDAERAPMPSTYLYPALRHRYTLEGQKGGPRSQGRTSVRTNPKTTVPSPLFLGYWGGWGDGSWGWPRGLGVRVSSLGNVGG